MAIWSTKLKFTYLKTFTVHKKLNLRKDNSNIDTITYLIIRVQ